MPTKAAKPGTERYRDERRNDSKPKMHGKQWHDHADAVVEGEQGSHLGRAEKVTRPSPETRGTGKSKAGAQRKRMTPVGKGLAGEKKRGGAGRNVVNADKIKSGPKKARR